MANAKANTASIRQIRYSKTNIGRDPRNALCDISPQDQAYYFDQLVSWMAALSEWGQQKDSYVWGEMIKRRPRQLSMGRQGPNSILTIVGGLLTNYIQNHKTYGVCRVSESQIEDFTWISHVMHSIQGDASPATQWVESLFDQDGTQF
jgi:hypothetical protein